jgi:DNA replication initiation complex subunit (GINS family)
MKNTRKIYSSLSVDESGLSRIERIADEIYRLQTALREALLDEIEQVEQEGPFRKDERRKIQTALRDDLALTGADLTVW